MREEKEGGDGGRGEREGEKGKNRRKEGKEGGSGKEREQETGKEGERKGGRKREKWKEGRRKGEGTRKTRREGGREGRKGERREEERDGEREKERRKKKGGKRKKRRKGKNVTSASSFGNETSPNLTESRNTSGTQACLFKVFLTLTAFFLSGNSSSMRLKSYRLSKRRLPREEKDRNVLFAYTPKNIYIHPKPVCFSKLSRAGSLQC